MLTFIEQFGILFLIVVAASFLIKLLKQPIIIGYVIGGALFIGFFHEVELINTEVVVLSEIGITFLLFLMGLEFDFKSLKYLGKDIFIVTSIQSLIFFLIGFAVTAFFNLGITERIYISILFMFSSTLLVAKWVEDKKETTTLHGKIILSTLIIQDIFAILAMTVLAFLKDASVTQIIFIPLKGILLFLIAFLFSRYWLNPLLKKTMRYPELLFVFSLGICFVFVEIAPWLGYSTTIGAFIGGVVLANTIYKSEISGRLKPLIVFFNMLFFVGLGFQLDLSLGKNIFFLIALLCLLSLLLKPIIIYVSLRLRNYDLKTSFLSGLYLSQVSEFGLIIIASGVAFGTIGSEMNAIAIICIVITFVISSIFISKSHKLFKYLEPFLAKIDPYFGKDSKKMKIDVEKEYNVLFFGYYDLGPELVQKLKSFGKKIVVIENDPEKISRLEKEGGEYIYNSISNPGFFETINFSSVDLVISGMTDYEENKKIIRRLKEKNPKAIAIVSAKNLKEAMSLYNQNADYVIVSSVLNHQKIAVLLEDYTTDIQKVIDQKVSHIKNLKDIELKNIEVNSNYLNFNEFIDMLIPKDLPKELQHHYNKSLGKIKKGFCYFQKNR